MSHFGNNYCLIVMGFSSFFVPSVGDGVLLRVV